VYGGLALNNASLTEVIDLLARQLKINYILDPRVKGGVILNTYGETKDIDTRSLLETILRINGFGMVKQGDLYRIVPLTDISHLPIPPEMKTDPNSIPEDDRTMLNLVFLKYVTADELAKVLEPFQGENARIYVYAPANLLLMLDSQRSMRRLMEMVALFDSDTLANQRVRVFTVKNGRPTDLAKELESISKAIALSEKNAPIKFLPIDRVNTIIAVAPNPGAFKEVEQWLEKLDIPIKASAGGIKDYVYRVRYGDATSMACSIQALYGQLSGYGGNGGYGGGQNAIQACMGTTGMGGNGFGNTYGGGGFGSSGFGGGGFGGGGFGGRGVWRWWRFWRGRVRQRWLWRRERWRIRLQSLRRRRWIAVFEFGRCPCSRRRGRFHRTRRGRSHRNLLGKRPDRWFWRPRSPRNRESDEQHPAGPGHAARIRGHPATDQGTGRSTAPGAHRSEDLFH
jgi:general secretion pathway protein D